MWLTWRLISLQEMVTECGIGTLMFAPLQEMVAEGGAVEPDARATAREGCLRRDSKPWCSCHCKRRLLKVRQ